MKKHPLSRTKKYITRLSLPDIRQTWWQLASIQVATAFSFPAILVGSLVSSLYGFKSAVTSIAIGNLILLLFGFVITKMGFRKRLNTLELTISYLGYWGGMIAGLVILIVTIFWIPIQMKASVSALMGIPSIQGYVSSHFPVDLISAIAIVTSLIVCFGIRGIKWFSVFSVPFIIFFVIKVFSNLDITLLNEQKPVSLLSVSPIITIAITRIVSMPVFFRHAKSSNHAYAALMIFILSISCSQILGAFITDGLINPDYIIDQFLKNTNSILVIAFIILGTINANISNIYIASMGWDLWVPKVIGKQEYFIIGLIGIVIYFITEEKIYFNYLVDSLKILISSLGGILLSCFFVENLKILKNNKVKLFLFNTSWILGVVFSIYSEIKNKSVLSLFSSFFISIFLIYSWKIVRFFYIRAYK